MDPKIKTILHREWYLKLVSVLLILLTGIVVLLMVDNMLISFVLAFVISYLLSPVVNFLESKGLSRQAAIGIPFVLAGITIGLGLYKIVPLLAQQAKLLELDLPHYQADLVNLLAGTEHRLRNVFNVYGINLSQTVNSWILAKTAEASKLIPSAISGSLTVLLLAPLFAFFMLQDGRQISRSILSMVPNSLFELALNLHHQLNEQMGGFIRARFLEAAIVGLVVFIGLHVFGFPYATLLALIAAITNLIPYIGPIIGAVPAVLIALLSEEALITTSLSLNLIVVTSIYFLAQLIDIVFIIPLVVARIVNLHPVTVIIVIIVGSQVMGILGMVISIPVASALKLIFAAVYDHLIEFRL